MAFQSPVFTPHHPEPHLENIFISEKSPVNLKKYQDYYNFEYSDKDTDLLKQFSHDCIKFFSRNKKFSGLNKQGEECILGFKLCYYEKGGAIYEPIIYKLNTTESLIDYKRMNMSKEDADSYNTITYYCERYKRLENILYVFADNQNYYQFNFHESNLCTTSKLAQMSQILKTNLLKNSLDTELPEKSENKVKMKI